MGAFLAGLARNLAAGLKLAFCLPVRRLAFRASLGQLVALVVVSALVDLGCDWWRTAGEGVFSWLGLGSELFAFGLLMLLSALLALAWRERPMLIALPVIVLASLPIVQVASTVRWDSLGIGPVAAYWVESVVFAWFVLVLVRSVFVILEYRRALRPWRALGGGLLLATPIFFSPFFSPVEPWFAAPSKTAADPRYPSPVSEPVLAAQAQLLDDALSALEDGRPGVTDLFFVGFAGDATEDVFRRDVLAARRIMDERWGTQGRSIVLVNNPRTLLTDPIASLTHLRDTLAEIAAAMDPDEDVAMIYLAAHGSRRHELDLLMPPLELAPITPAVLRNALDESGIRFRIVVISACYSGGFVDALAGDDTAVFTAARADRTSFGCGLGSESTWFGEAFFADGMARGRTIDQAFEIARIAVAERERARGFAPSEPQSSIGAGIARRLPTLDRRGGEARRDARLVVRPAV